MCYYSNNLFVFFIFRYWRMRFNFNFPNLISLRSDSSSSLIKSSPVDYIDISDDIRQTNGFLYITSALPVLYIAIILSVSGFTVIASNVLCENLKASHDFRILKNIGYDIHTLEKITLYHLSAIFIIPLFSAVLFSFFISFTYCRSCGALYFVPFKKLLFCFFVSFENLTNFRFFSMLFYFYKIHDFRFLGDHSIIPHQAKKPSPKLKMIQLYSVGKIQYCYRSKIAVEINYSRVGFS